MLEVCILTFPDLECDARRPRTPLMPAVPSFALCRLIAGAMTGHLRAMACKFDMEPPPGEAVCTAVLVERERRVATLLFLRKGQTPFELRRRASITVDVVFAW